MSKKPPIAPEELALFQKAMTGCKPLKLKQHRIHKPPPVIKPIRRIEEEEIVLARRDIGALEAVSGDELLGYKHISISDKILRKLRKGQYNVEAILDLHGMRVAKAQIVVNKFLQEALQQELRVVLIIHGKGHHSQLPILKNKVNYWLRQLTCVLAFCSATINHGSSGATYVLLKQGRKEDIE
jgi:DNA-nicking Smr family endonuclease